MQVDPKSGAHLQPLQSARVPNGDGQAIIQTLHPGSSTAFVPTAMLIGLLTELKRLPEVREESVRHARAKLAKGDLLSKAASFEVAEALLGAETPGE